MFLVGTIPTSLVGIFTWYDHFTSYLRSKCESYQLLVLLGCPDHRVCWRTKGKMFLLSLTRGETPLEDHHPTSSSTFLEFLPGLRVIPILLLSNRMLPPHIQMTPLHITKNHLTKTLLHFIKFHPPFIKMLLLTVPRCSQTTEHPHQYIKSKL